METKDRELAQADRAARIEALVRQLSETEHTLQELLAGEVDAVIDPVRGTPIILRQAQAALRRSEARMRLLLAHIPALVWTTDENLCMTSTAGRELEAVREAIGMRAEALVGHSLVDVAREHKALAGVLAAHYRALEGQTASYDTTIERRIFHGTIEPLCDESGQIVGCVGLGLDVTHQRRIEDVFGGRLSAARHKLEALAERSSGLPTKYRALVEEVLESSSIAVEELQVSVEELHQQNEELATMQNELEASRRSYQDLFESAPDGYLVTDPAGIIRRANRAAVELLGVSKRVLQDKPLVIYVAQEERAEFHRRLDQVQAGKKQARSEWELHMRNRAYDSIFPAALTVSPIRDQEGTLTGLRWLLRDISASKRAEERERLLEEVQVAAEETRAANRLLRTLLDTMPVGVVVCNAEGALLMTNTPGQEILGERVTGNVAHPHRSYTPHYPDGRPFPASEMPLTHAIMLGETVSNVEILIHREDGTERTILAGAAPVHNGAGHIVSGVTVFQDITERKQAQAEIKRLLAENRAQHALLERLIAAAPMGIAVVRGPEHKYEMANPAYCATLGLEAAEIAGRRFTDVFPDIAAGGTLELLEKVYRSGEVASIHEYAPPAGEGQEETYWDIDLIPLQDVEDKVNRILILTYEITERTKARKILQEYAGHLEKQVQQRTAALRASNARFRSIFEDAAIGIALVNQQGHIITGNPALRRILGYNEEELEGLSLAALTHPDNVGDDLRLYNELIAGERPYYQLEGRYMHKDGHAIAVNLTVSLVQQPGENARFAIAMIEDISEKKDAQAALIQSEKLALSGRLAASLSHEINNPLQSVIGFMSLVKESLQEGETEEEDVTYIEIALEEVKRAAGLVARMRDLNRPSDPSEREPGDVNALVERVLTLNQKRCQEQCVEVTLEVEEDVPAVLMAADRIQQVFLNLMINALDAMPEGGALQISTARTEAPLGVEIRFTDSGKGIAADKLADLFKPFHTTKNTGLGLGLYISHKIIQEHGGRIAVESVEGDGTTFTVWLPITACGER